jgi:hypothetical protein
LSGLEWKGIAVFRFLLWAQGAVCAAAALGSVLRVPPFSTLWYFLVLQTGVTVGLLRAVLGRAPAAWVPDRHRVS